MEGGVRQLNPGARPIRIGIFKTFVLVADAQNKEAVLCRIIREGLAPCVHNQLKREPVGFYTDGDKISMRNGGADIYPITRYRLEVDSGSLTPMKTLKDWTSHSYFNQGNSYIRTPDGMLVFLSDNRTYAPTKSSVDKSSLTI